MRRTADGKLGEYAGNYTYYQQKKREEALAGQNDHSKALVTANGIKK